ncbi:ubiquitin family domain-containing protein [Ditylenchus destructor]|uniref:Ubiquitin family domain-containing protein n=1 Tax=Ditylenchus destructor TaxID=166010 RepID=A0AAD4MJV4_9BILA|nr:ubiquitin family domain-containing protein [Ditylenchus destructor]
MRILLKLFVVIDGTTRKIQLERIDERSTIAQLKAKIRDQDNIPVEEQCLIFNDSELENGKTLKSYAVKDRSTLRLVRLTSTKITVFVIIDGSARKFKLNLDTSDTVNQVKAKIGKQTDIPADQRNLYYQNTILENDKTLAYYGIKNRATILLVRHDSSDKANNAWKVARDMASFGANVVAIGGPALSIVVFAYKCIKKKPENDDSKNDNSGNDNSPIRIDGNESDLVSKVKDMIGQNKGIPSEHHALYWEFKLLDDNRTMSDLNIKNGSVLLLVEKTFGKKLENQLFESALERKYIWNYFLEELQNGNFGKDLLVS